MSGLVIVEPTTMLRDFARDLLGIDQVWAGGWPQNDHSAVGVVLTTVGSLQDGPITRWSTQWDAYAATQPAASALGASLATALSRAELRQTIGTTDVGTVLWGGVVEGSINMRPVIPGDPDDPDTYRHLTTLDLLTIAVPTL